MRAGVPFERLWRMLVRLWWLFFIAHVLQTRLGVQIDCKCSPNCSASAKKGKIRQIFIDVVALGTLRIELSAARELDSQVFATLPFKTFPELPKCVRKTSQERFGKPLGRALVLSWALLGCS